MALFGARRAATPSADAASYRSAAATHVGRVRRVNEDRVLDRPDRGLWAVADGMGGLARGDVAAQMAIDSLERLAARTAPIGIDDILLALEKADRRIRTDDGSRAGGTTIVALLADTDGATLIWAGDSRAYRIGAGPPERLTRDHSLVADLVEAGLVAPADADQHPQANVVTRALGAGEPVPPEIRRIDFAAGDRLLLASDGCYRSLAPGDAGRMIVPAVCAERLVANAVERDGSDNATCVVIDRAT